jgi:integrase
MPHLIRARRFGADLGYVVSADGAKVVDIKKGFAAAAAKAGLEGVSPHTLKHTCISWLMQAGRDPWRVSDFTATSMDTILKVYGHHHPDHQSEIADNFGRRPQNVRVMR